jgi:hypothetical protein
VSFKKLLFVVSIISTCLSSDVFAGRSVSFRPSGAVGDFDQSLGKTVTKAILASTVITSIEEDVTSVEEEISTPPVQHKFIGKSKS